MYAEPGHDRCAGPCLRLRRAVVQRPLSQVAGEQALRGVWRPDRPQGSSLPSVIAPRSGPLPAGPKTTCVNSCCPSTRTQARPIGSSSSRPSASSKTADRCGRMPRRSSSSAGSVVLLAPVSTIASTSSNRCAGLVADGYRNAEDAHPKPVYSPES